MKEFIATLPKNEAVEVEDLTEDMEIEIAEVEIAEVPADTPSKNDVEAQNLSVNDFSIVSSTTSNDSLEVNPQSLSDASVPEVPVASERPAETEVATEKIEAVADSTTIDDSKSKKSEFSKIAKTQLRSSKAAGKNLGPLKVFNPPKEILHVDFAELIVEREI